jgi:D-alanyl-lipoteichoic acid acyltransferase DltB (MBOAT superfamily)
VSELLYNIFAYAHNKPLLFTQLFFWGFFLLLLAGYSLVYRRNKMKTVYLLVFSLFFYFKTSGVFILFLLFTVCSDFFLAKAIHKHSLTRKGKWLLAISVTINLCLLSFFKYAYFFVDSYNSIASAHVPFVNHFAKFTNTFFATHFSVDKLILPVGISFFTFQSMSYTIDIYRKKVQPVKHITDYGFFVSFFPHLVAGPIVKAHDFIDQIYQPYKLSKTEFGMALFWIINGFAKKIVADYLAVNFIDRIFDNPHFYSGLETGLGVLGYSLQIYMDFSGYTDMAIGLALILGYRLKKNFNSPYKATSTSEFWKRWHMSLSSWLQEYLYIPLGGNRSGSIGSYVAIVILSVFLVLLAGKFWLLYVMAGLALLLLLLAFISEKVKNAIHTNINLMVTMLLGGLWHGSSWLFIIWGGLNGLGLIVHKLWQKISPFKDSTAYATRFMLMLVTLVFISFTRIFFRSDTMEKVSVIFDRLINHFGANLFWKVLSAYPYVLLLMFLGYLIHWIPENIKENYRQSFAAMPYWCMALISVFLVFVMYQLMSGEMQAFIYFQF